MGTFARNLRWTLGASLLIGAANFLAGAWFSRVLGPARLGEYVVLFTAIQLAWSFLSPGFDQAVVRQPGDAAIGRAALWATHLQVALLGVAGWAVLLWLGKGASASPGQAALLGSTILAGSLLGPYGNLTAAPLAGRLRYQALALARLGSVGAGLLVGLLAVPLGALALAVRDLVTVAVFALMVLWASPWPVEWRADRSGLGDLFQFSLPLWGLNVLERLVVRLDYALVGLLFGAEQLGIYFAIRSLIDGLTGFLVQPIQTVLFAHHCHDPNDSGRWGWSGRSAAVSFGAAVGGLALIAWVFAPWAIQILLGSIYVPGAALLPGFILLSGSTLLFESTKVAAMAAGTHRRAVWARLAQLAVLVPLVMVFGRTFGLAGAGWASGLAGLVLVGSDALVQGVARRRRGSLPPPDE